MKFRRQKGLIQFFDVSIIMSLYKEIKDFKRVLHKNVSFFQRNGIEVIIILNEQAEEEELLNFIQQYPLINFKIIINRNKHDYRNHSKVLNVGLRHASFDYILSIDPEVELLTDVIYQLRYVLEHYPNTFATGLGTILDQESNFNDFENLFWSPYGSIMIKKKDLLAINGYDESFEQWCGEYNLMSRRLEMNGINRMNVLEARTLYREDGCDFQYERVKRIRSMPVKLLKHILYPKKVVINDNYLGDDFGEIIWDWNAHKSYSGLKKHLKSFNDSSILNTTICEKHYDIIALIQVRNEVENIVEILPHIENYCDGVLLLDDGSTDGSYETAKNDKLLVKVQKLYKGYFDDLENRNDLLKLASFFKSRWFLFIDADERFDPRYDDIRGYINKKDANVYRFHLIDLWDNPETYRIDIPDRKNNGIANRARLFRNKGSMQIYANRELHFSVAPYSSKMQIANILLLHYGNYSNKIRERKYELYSSQDPDGKKNGFTYEFLKDEKVILGELDKLSLDNLGS